MALSPAGLAAAIKAEQGPAEDEAIQDAYNLKLATAIVDYITANAVVTVDPGIPVTTAGPPTSHTGATTAPGSGTIS